MRSPVIFAVLMCLLSVAPAAEATPILPRDVTAPLDRRGGSGGHDAFDEKDHDVAARFAKLRDHLPPGELGLGLFEHSQRASRLFEFLWHLEREHANGANAGSHFGYVALAHFAARGRLRGAGHVRVLNLYFPGASGGSGQELEDQQDQLTIAGPDPGLALSSVPEPALLLLLGSGLAGVWLRRRHGSGR